MTGTTKDSSLDKNKLAQEITKLIREWGQHATDFQEGNVSEMWFHAAKKIHQEKLVLYAGALAAIVLREQQNTDQKINSLQKKVSDLEFHEPHFKETF